jgi:hypothetical protein
MTTFYFSSTFFFRKKKVAKKAAQKSNLNLFVLMPLIHRADKKDEVRTFLGFALAPLTNHICHSARSSKKS